MDTSVSAKTTSARTGRKATSKARSTILEGRRKSLTKACTNGEDIGMEDVQNREEVAMVVKKGGR